MPPLHHRDQHATFLYVRLIMFRYIAMRKASSISANAVIIMSDTGTASAQDISFRLTARPIAKATPTANVCRQ